MTNIPETLDQAINNEVSVAREILEPEFEAKMKAGTQDPNRHKLLCAKVAGRIQLLEELAFKLGGERAEGKEQTESFWRLYPTRQALEIKCGLLTP